MQENLVKRIKYLYIDGNDNAVLCYYSSDKLAKWLSYKVNYDFITLIISTL